MAVNTVPALFTTATGHTTCEECGGDNSGMGEVEHAEDCYWN